MPLFDRNNDWMLPIRHYEMSYHANLNKPDPAINVFCLRSLIWAGHICVGFFLQQKNKLLQKPNKFSWNNTFNSLSQKWEQYNI